MLAGAITLFAVAQAMTVFVARVMSGTGMDSLCLSDRFLVIVGHAAVTARPQTNPPVTFSLCLSVLSLYLCLPICSRLPKIPGPVPKTAALGKVAAAADQGSTPGAFRRPGRKKGGRRRLHER